MTDPIAQWYEDKRLEADRLREEIAYLERLVGQPIGAMSRLEMLARLARLRKLLEQAEYVGD